jgi:pathogenesis-related protein 1
MKYLFFILIMTFTIPLTSISQMQYELTGSQFSHKQVNDFLAHHNMARAEFNVAPLKWDASIATYAQEWAEYLAKKKKCKLLHRDDLEKNPENFGENLYWISSGDHFEPVRASLNWYEEKPLFEKNNFRFNHQVDMGHYTQMIWANTTHVGAGYAQCPSGAIIVVANYDPPGNYIGSSPF